MTKPIDDHVTAADDTRIDIDGEGSTYVIHGHVVVSNGGVRRVVSKEIYEQFYDPFRGKHAST